MPRGMYERVKIPALERFNKYWIPEPNSGCWLWLGACDGHGYGVLNLDGFVAKAHRFSYRTFRGPIPKGLLICHKCDVRPCCNPNHLFLGTHADNHADMKAKDRPRGRPYPTARLWKHRKWA